MNQHLLIGRLWNDAGELELPIAEFRDYVAAGFGGGECHLFPGEPSGGEIIVTERGYFSAPYPVTVNPVTGIAVYDTVPPRGQRRWTVYLAVADINGAYIACPGS